MADPNVYKRYRKASVQLTNLTDFLECKHQIVNTFILNNLEVRIERKDGVVTLTHKPYEGRS